MKCSSEMALTRASTKAWPDASNGGGRGGRIMSSTRWPGERGGIWGVGGVTTTEAAVRLPPSVLLVLVLVLLLWLLLWLPLWLLPVLLLPSRVALRSSPSRVRTATRHPPTDASQTMPPSSSGKPAPRLPT